MKLHPKPFFAKAKKSGHQVRKSVWSLYFFILLQKIMLTYEKKTKTMSQVGLQKLGVPVFF